VIHQDSNSFSYYLSLDEIKAEGLTPVPVNNLLQFFTLRGKTSKLAKENLIPLEIEYVILAKEADITKYYLRKYKGWSIDEIYFMKRSLNFSGSDESIENLHRYVFDDKVWLIFTPEMVEETKKMLDRVRKANVKTGVLDYRTYITILEAEIRLEEYRVCYSSGMGFRTGCKLQEDNVRNMWLKVAKKPPKA
jgi:hypothetical protein